MLEDREQTLAHLRLVCCHAGFWELRALRRVDGNAMEPRGSFFIIASKTAAGLIYDRIDQAVDWAATHDRNGAEVFIGMNPRAHEGKSKDAVEYVTACYVDLDLPEGETIESAVIQLHEANRPAPSLIVSSGYGLHVVYLLTEPSADKDTWKRIQRGLVRCWADLGADRAVAPDESRLLRLVPYPNRKRWPAGVPTAILETTEHRYTLEELATAFDTTEGTSFSRNEILTFTPRPFVDETPAEDGPTAAGPTVEDMQELAKRAEGVRRVLELWIKRNMKPGIHWGIIPIDGKDPSKPTLFKPGAELVALLYGWRDIARVLGNLGHSAYRTGKLSEAEVRLEEARTLAQKLGEKPILSYALQNLGQLRTKQGQSQQAEQILRESMLLTRELGGRFLALEILGDMAVLGLARGDAARAARLAGAEKTLRERLGIPCPSDERAGREAACDQARAMLGEEDFTHAMEQGGAMSLEEAIAFALGETT